MLTGVKAFCASLMKGRKGYHILVFCFSPRIRFMLEIISNLRNNNLKKIPGYDPSRIEHLRKVLRSVVRNSSKTFYKVASFFFFIVDIRCVLENHQIPSLILTPWRVLRSFLISLWLFNTPFNGYTFFCVKK